MWLQVLVTTGLIGLTIFAGHLLVLGHAAVRLARSGQANAMRHLGFFLIFSWVVSRLGDAELFNLWPHEPRSSLLLCRGGDRDCGVCQELGERLVRIAFCHNFYQQPGGEDQVFRAESAMMEEHGHAVLRYTKHNDEINDLSRLALVKKTFWNGQVYRELQELLREFQPDVVHFTNTFPLISPAAYKAARRSGAVVVQSLHNFRTICPGRS